MSRRVCLAIVSSSSARRVTSLTAICSTSSVFQAPPHNGTERRAIWMTGSGTHSSVYRCGIGGDAMSTQRTLQIALIPGDGIGIEVVSAAVPVLRAACERFGAAIETTSFPWGSEFYLEHGEMMPQDGLAQLRPFDAILLGAVGHPTLVPDHITLHGLLLAIRRGFEQSINMRPHKVLPGVQSPLRRADFDILCIRENSEGEYVGAGGRAHSGTPDEVVIETSIFTRRGCERVMRFAFEEARKRSGRLAC